MKTTTWLLAAWLLLALVAVHQRGYDSATPVSRLNLLQELVGRGTLNIDRVHQNTPDKAYFGGHYYSDKAPGTAALALPAYAAAARVAGWRGVDLDGSAGKKLVSWAACAFSQALPAALGGAAVLAWLNLFVRRRAGLLAVLGLTLGGLALPYSTLLFSHAQVIGLIGIAIWASGLFCPGLMEATGGPGPSTREAGRGRMALAGLCLGLALASEYTAGIVVLGIGLELVLREWRRGPDLGGAGGHAGSAIARAGADRWRPALACGLGALPPLLLIPAYSWATIGSPFELPYSYQASFAPMKEGLYAIKWPDAENLGRLLIGPTRGLIFWTPFLIMAGFGWWWIAKERPRWLWLTYAVPVLHMLVISGRVWDWQAGYTISARYMAPIIPLLALPCAIGTQRWPKLGATLALVSIGLMTLATITDACPDSDRCYLDKQRKCEGMLHAERHGWRAGCDNIDVGDP
ncbi:MAG: DUF2079 domain-containing protein [Verrucomicrobia bacterium]|nr:DUF2079 domain-containing protein [Verrucomicrobiota bacterium]